MVYVKAIQSYDTQIENLEIKSDKTFALLVVSFAIILPAIVIVYHVIDFNPYVAQLIPLCLELYFIIACYTLMSLTIYQGILEMCRNFLLAKELFIRVTGRYGFKKGASSLIKKYVGSHANKSRSILPQKIPHSTKLTAEYLDSRLKSNKNLSKETINQINYLEQDVEEKKEERRKAESNNDSLIVAAEWLWDLVKDLGKMKNPNHEKVENRIKKDFPKYDGVPDMPNINFIWGEKINKSKIDIALTHLFNKRHDKSISEGTIESRRLSD